MIELIRGRIPNHLSEIHINGSESAVCQRGSVHIGLSAFYCAIYASLLLLFVASAAIQAQSRLSGKPIIKHYSYKEYRAHPQNFTVVQDERGVAYIANYRGILEYDGVTWRRIPLPHNSYPNSLLSSKDGRIYVGGSDEAGYLAADEKGQMHYYSLMPKIREMAAGETLEFYSVVQHGDSVIFVDPFTMFILHDGKMESEAQTTYGGVVSFQESLIMPNEAFLLSMQQADGELRPIDGHKLLPANDIVIDIVKVSEDEALVVYADRIFKFDYPITTDGSSSRFEEIPNPIQEGEAIRITDAIYLGNGITALGTSGAGVLFIDRNGKVKRRLNKDNGLKDNYIWGLHKDKQGLLWMALDNGIARTPIDPDFLYWDDTKGLRGYVTSVLRHRETLYVGTGIGLFKMNALAEFELVDDGEMEVYNMLNFKVPGSDDLLIVGSMWGVFGLEGNRLKQLPLELSTVSGMLQSRIDPSILYVSTSSVYALKYENGKWELLDQIRDVANFINGIEEAEDGSLWLQTSPRELIHLRLDKPGALAESQITAYENVPPPLSQDGINLLKLSDGQVLFGTGRGVMAFDPIAEDENAFVPSDLIGERYKNASFSINRIEKDQKDQYWIAAADGDKRWIEKSGREPDKDGNIAYQKDSISFVTLYNTYVECIYPDSNTVWFGGPDGVFQYIPRNAAAQANSSSCLISKVAINKDSVLYYGREEPKFYKLPFDYNSIMFSFALPSFINEDATQYNYRLKGYEDQWSGWGNDHRKEYTNLPEGDYTFEVMARDTFGDDTKVTAYSFKVQPPIYRTWYAYVFYVVFGLGIIVAGVALNAKRLLREKERLEGLVETRTKEVVLKNQALEQQKEEISKQAANLRKANEEVMQKHLEIESQKAEIELQRDMLTDQNSEIISQRDQLEKAYNNVTVLSEIGQDITANLEVEGIIDTVYKSVNTLMDGAGFGIGIYNANMHRLEFPGYIEKGEKLPFHFNGLAKDDTLGACCFNRQEEIVINDYASEVNSYLGKEKKEQPGEVPKSIIYLPLKSQNRQTLGVITVQSFEAYAYSKYQIDMLRNISIYTGIALENAFVYQEISKQNRKITDSINYAQNIQSAMLPTEEEVKGALGDSFILFRPRDIVSGDFYWMAEHEGKIMIAAVDCTGHGVPGAFMSLVGDGFLNQLVKLQGLMDPAIVLTALHQLVHKALHQNNSNSRDGMDISMCCLDLENKVLTYAGARNPLVKIDSEGKIHSIKADRYSIGGRQVREEHHFTKHEMTLTGDDMYYLFSDGYQDQFGGEKDQKLYRKNFYRLLNSIYHLPCNEQQQFLDNFLTRWVGKRSQIDDVLVIGFKA